MKAHEFILDKKYKEGLEIMREGLHSIPIKGMLLSQRTFYYYLRNVYKAFVLAKLAGEKKTAARTYKLLEKTNNSFGLLACLTHRRDYRECEHLFRWQGNLCAVASGRKLQFDHEVLISRPLFKFLEKRCRRPLR